ncbi:MAG: SDR family NAD(P)-dependent oxidoreductase [Nitrospirae bacterium]|nr:SDR family NAD(P)-dependent oxidoreductase [Nitrospirota bacterium]
MKKAVIIGATSGIGKELAKVLSQSNYIVGLAGRRVELLAELQKEIPSITYFKRIDVTKTKEAMNLLEDLINEMGGMDLTVISSGVGFLNPDLNWEQEKETIDVNVSGFAAMVNVAIKQFLKQGSGHLVGISSIAAIRGNGDAPAYNASKAFVSNYLEGIRQKIIKLGTNIIVTDIQPGYVDTSMAKGGKLFWVASPEKAAWQIYKAIKHKKKHVYITKRWRLIAWLLKVVPDWIYNKL